MHVGVHTELRAELFFVIYFHIHHAHVIATHFKVNVLHFCIDITLLQLKSYADIRFNP